MVIWCQIFLLISGYYCCCSFFHHKINDWNSPSILTLRTVPFVMEWPSQGRRFGWNGTTFHCFFRFYISVVFTLYKTCIYKKHNKISVVDPGFPAGGTNFFPKLRQIDRNGEKNQGLLENSARSARTPFRSASEYQKIQNSGGSTQ